jgi:16S rRNA (guanine966-N2)-methyltransferase
MAPLGILERFGLGMFTRMHVIGGIAKGKRLQSLHGRKIRPTSALVREALFDILADTVDGCRFLDVFAGTGAVGIEALSRGAERLTAVENHPAAVRVLYKNLDACGFRRQTEVVHFDAGDALMMLNNRNQLFDIVFLDPPYGDPAGENALMTAAQYPVANPGASIIYEHFHKQDPGQAFGRLSRRRMERWGDTCLSFYVQA